MSTTATPAPIILSTEQSNDMLFALLRHVTDWYRQTGGRLPVTNDDIEDLGHRAETLARLCRAMALPVLREELARERDEDTIA